LAAAAIAGLGLYLLWLRTDTGIIGIPGGRVLDEVAGWELTAGLVALAAVAVAAFLALLWLALARTVAAAAAGLILAGATIVAAAIYVGVAPADRFVDWAASTAANAETTSDEIQSLLPRFFEANDVSVSPELGLYLTLAGGALMLLVGVVALIISRRRSRSPGGPAGIGDGGVEPGAGVIGSAVPASTEVARASVAGEPAPAEGAEDTSGEAGAPPTASEELSGGEPAPSPAVDDER